MIHLKLLKRRGPKMSYLGVTPDFTPIVQAWSLQSCL